MSSTVSLNLHRGDHVHVVDPVTGFGRYSIVRRFRPLPICELLAQFQILLITGCM
jgi:hypothetical protein